tara:strand:- start:49 stop:912 length:864 start_codon:yes stop_codon:yes gene_type:complete
MSPIHVGNRKISGSLASDPVGVSTSAGSIYYNTTDDELRLYDGSSWTAIGGDSGLGISQNNPITSFDQASIDGVYWIRPTGTAVGDEFQTYINKSEGNGGWALAWVVTNVNGDGVNWWNGDSSMSGNTGTNHFTSSTSTFGTPITTDNAKSNAKNSLFNTYQFSKMMIIENHSGTMGVKQYNMNTTQTFVHHFNNQSGNNLVSSVLKTSGSFATFNTSSLYFNYTLGNDGARIAAATASSEAVGGISARVDGARGYNWKGNLTRNDSNRAYGSDGTTTDHTVWIYVQ